MIGQCSLSARPFRGIRRSDWPGDVRPRLRDVTSLVLSLEFERWKDQLSAKSLTEKTFA